MPIRETIYMDNKEQGNFETNKPKNKAQVAVTSAMFLQMPYYIGIAQNIDPLQIQGLNL